MYVILKNHLLFSSKRHLQHRDSLYVDTNENLQQNESLLSLKIFP